MNALVQQFAFEGQEVPVIHRDNMPWWPLTAVCSVLGITNAGNAAARLDSDEKGIHIMDTLGGRQEMTVINESGLWSLVLSSRKKAAKRFKKWLTSEVIPSIRRTGGYVMSAPGDSQADLVARALSAAEEAIRRQGAAIDTLAPKAAAYDRLAQSTDQVSLTEGAKALGRPRGQFLAMLHKHRWIYRQKPSRPWLAHADKERVGLLAYRVTDIPDRDGHLVSRHQVLLTARGLTHLAQLLPKWEAASC
ncbi:phage antirepressor [Gluconacetobacter sp. Hr-1-5]|uniref:phage antirepressor n=1 Tax=Gluconacetobacter sp. Hr-1-5 TaxID=3395370 RepID=UPI003B517FC6